MTHVHLILAGQTTVESMQVRALREQEEMALADTFGCCQIMYAVFVFFPLPSLLKSY